MFLRNKLIILCLLLCLYPGARWLDHQKKNRTSQGIYNCTGTREPDSLYQAIAACISFEDDSLTTFKDGYFIYRINGNKYRTHISRDSIVINQSRITFLPHYLEIFENSTSNKVIKRSYGQYDLLGISVSSHCIDVTPQHLFMMLEEYKRALNK